MAKKMSMYCDEKHDHRIEKLYYDKLLLYLYCTYKYTQAAAAAAVTIAPPPPP